MAKRRPTKIAGLPVFTCPRRPGELRLTATTCATSHKMAQRAEEEAKVRLWECIDCPTGAKHLAALGSPKRPQTDSDLPEPLRAPTAAPAVPALAWFHAVHNQGHGDRIRGAIAKAEGVRRGVPDTFLPWPVAHWHGLYIEMKKPTERPKTKGKGGVSDEQGAFGAYALRAGYGWAVCYSWREAADTLRAYIEWNGEA